MRLCVCSHADDDGRTTRRPAPYVTSRVVACDTRCCSDTGGAPAGGAAVGRDYSRAAYAAAIVPYGMPWGVYSGAGGCPPGGTQRGQQQQRGCATAYGSAGARPRRGRPLRPVAAAGTSIPRPRAVPYMYDADARPAEYGPSLMPFVAALTELGIQFD
jgi:hypothetical protein